MTNIAGQIKQAPAYKGVSSSFGNVTLFFHIAENIIYIKVQIIHALRDNEIISSCC